MAMKMLRGIGKGVGGSAVEGVAGVVAFYGHRMLSSKVAFVQQHPLAAPGALLVLGHILKKQRKLSGVGVALCGIAGYAGAQVFELQKASTAANTPAGTAGFEGNDTGMVVATRNIGDVDGYEGGDDTGMLVQPGNTGDFNPDNAYSDAYSMGH